MNFGALGVGGMLMLMLSLTLQLGMVLVPLFVLYLAWRAVRALERRAQPAADAAAQARIAELEEAIVRMESEMAQMAEEQRFVARLLGQRPDSTEPASAK